MDDYVDPELKRELRRQIKAAKVQAAQDDAVIQSIMSTPPGRAWMRTKLESCLIFHTTYTGEALSGAFKEGQRTIGLMLLTDVMRACPEQYIRMMGEQSGGRSSDRDRSDPDDERNWDGESWIGDGPEPTE